METEECKEIAETILMQMGGPGKLKAMLGVTKYVTDEHGSLIFKFKGSTKMNIVSIRLNGSDLYDMTFYDDRRNNAHVVKTENDLYNDQLKERFESCTGLRLSL